MQLFYKIIKNILHQFVIVHFRSIVFILHVYKHLKKVAVTRKSDKLSL